MVSIVFGYSPARQKMVSNQACQVRVVVLGKDRCAPVSGYSSRTILLLWYYSYLKQEQRKQLFLLFDCKY